MHKIIFAILLSSLVLSSAPESFKTQQKRYKRVRQAYLDKQTFIENRLAETDIQLAQLEVCLRAFKKEMKLELWGKNKNDDSFQLLKTFDICQSSGQTGPKRKQGDYQVPEGFYHIDRFNPASNFYLSLGINYPNRSDKILGEKGNLGGDIFIHGSCVTIGCIPITNNQIKELYVYCVEARNNGQQKIPVTISPMKMTDENYAELKNGHQDAGKTGNLYEALKDAYAFFNKNKRLPKVEFLSNGNHRLITN
jgi:murein L,D-transpeptidase YafK